MTTAAVTGVTSYQILPTEKASMYQVSYTKAAQNDTFALASYTPIKTILFTKAKDDTLGTVDATTFSGTTITLAGTQTGTGTMIVVGLC